MFIIVYKLFYKQKENKCNKCLNKAWFVFAFTIYIRLFLETSQYVLLTSFYELTEFNIQSSPQIVSLIISLLIYILCLAYLTFSVYLWIKHRRYFDKHEHKHFKEMFNGIRNRHRARSYTSMLMLRRVILVIFLITSKHIDATVSVSIFASIQFIYLTIIVWFRPYRLAKDNLMELVNELLFSTLL